MNPNIRDVLLSLTIVCVIFGLILILFEVTGNIELISQLLQSTAEGEIAGLTFTTIGPFGMFVISFYMLRYTRRETPLWPIKLWLYFSDEDHPVPPPSQPIEFSEASCRYTVYSNDRIVRTVDVNIRFEQRSPYIYVSAPEVDNPELEVRLEYGGHEFISESFSPKVGRVTLG